MSAKGLPEDSFAPFHDGSCTDDADTQHIFFMNCKRIKVWRASSFKYRHDWVGQIGKDVVTLAFLTFARWIGKCGRDYE